MAARKLISIIKWWKIGLAASEKLCICKLELLNISGQFKRFWGRIFKFKTEFCLRI